MSSASTVCNGVPTPSVIEFKELPNEAWIPAFAGMTTVKNHSAQRQKRNIPVIPAKAGIQIHP